ncbi:hypothetical protein FGG08_005137 [Glutinoglossum americanum]|uniref:Transcription elongation factor SPT5 n=1 Tax=Glutinoglossum americanum TaxID=1670608 RepID=A0A9P8HYT8_9PEZI|nr:hypothetical protein FGG08_005137 [Glutinoglossum americanum]
MSKIFSKSDVASHKTPTNLWIIIDQDVYDLTKFQDEHPVLSRVAGKDASAQFWKYHSEGVLKKYKARLQVGSLDTKPKAAALPKPPPSSPTKSAALPPKTDSAVPVPRPNKAEAALDPYGDLVPFSDPSWYQNYHSPYHNETHVALREEVRKWVDTEVEPYVGEWDEARKVPDYIYKQLGEMGYLAGLLGIHYPTHLTPYKPKSVPTEKWDLFHELLLTDELSRSGSGGFVWNVIGGFGIGCPPIIKFGKKSLVERIVPGILSGDKRICLAITEPDAGSDVANLTCEAKLSADGKHYIVNGEKKWITNAIWSDYFTTAVRTGGPGMGGVSVLLIERDSGGVSTRKMDCQGVWSSGTSYITFEDVKVPVENLIGKENQGFKVVMTNFNHERIGIIIQCIRFSRVCFEESMKYAHKRRTFGKKLIDHPVIRLKLAHMARQIEASYNWLENIIYQCSKMGETEAMLKLGGAIAGLKAQSTVTFEFCAREASQIFGGLSYSRGGQGGKVERLYRDVRAYAIPGGSEEIMLDLSIRQSLKEREEDIKITKSIMDGLRLALQPITHNLPPPVSAFLTSLVGPDCYRILFLDLDPNSPVCLKLLISKALGIGIIAASSIVKVPQILKLLSSGSAQGVSFLSYALETAGYTISLAYNVRQGFPFSTYGETALIAVQNVVIAVLVLRFSGKGAEAAGFVAALAVLGAALFREDVVGGGILSVFQVAAGLLGVVSKAPQIWTVWKEGGTGQLSAFAVFNYLLGSLTRIFTTLQEVDDKLILYSFIAAFTLNAILAAQMAYYWNSGDRVASKKVAVGPSKDSTSTESPAATATPTKTFQTFISFVVSDMSSADLLNNDFGSDSEDDNDFNPAPADVSDHDDAEGHSEDERFTRDPKRDEKARHRDGGEGTNGAESKQRSDRNGRAKISRDGDGEGDNDDEHGTADGEGDEDGGGDDDDEDDEDEDEDDEDDEDEEAMLTNPKGHRRKRRRERRNGLRTFIDVEAEVDEDEDELEEEDEDFTREDGFIADTHPDDLADLPAGGETDDRRHRQLDRQREREAGLDAEKQAEVFKQRYGRSRAPTAVDAVAVPKRLLLPSVEDPSIWGVKCKPGKEREVIFGIMKRVEERVGTKMQLSISSAFERGGTMSGYIYVEARKQSDILTALDGLSNVYPRTRMVLVPIKEMPDLLRTTKTKALEPGAYVRIKRGKYQGDLAQIDAVETNGLEVLLRIVPRLDYGLNEDANAPEQELHPAAKRKRAGGIANNLKTRPPQRLFSEVEARKKHAKYLQRVRTGDKTHWTYLGDDYDNGYLMKDFKIQHLQTEDVAPKLEEVTLFASGAEDGTENLDLNALAASLREGNANATYLPGDMVEVYDGEQQGVYGKAERVTGNIVALRVTGGELRGQLIDAPVKSLRKRFKEGDHVKVVGGGRFTDEVGMVVRVRDDKVTLLSDTNFTELTVFSKDLREASDSGTSGATSNYSLFDLVQLDPTTVACVTKVDRESLRMIDQNGSVRTVLPSQISNLLSGRRNVVAVDRDGSEIQVGDTVREVGGEQKRGEILHIHRTYAFLHNREQIENSGIFVVRTSNIVTVAAKGGRVSRGPDLSKMNPEVQRNGGNMSPPAVPQKSFGGRDRALGKTVTIRKGPYKGLLGIVKDTTDTDARVELHTKAKTITVSKDTLGFKDPLTGAPIDYATFSGPGRSSSVMGGATPSRTSNVVSSWEGRRTPLNTGMSESRTPAWGIASRKTFQDQRQDSFGGRTPAYVHEGGRTVNPYFEGGGRTVNPYADGSRTQYGSGNKTPAWNPGSRTPYGAGDAWNAGSKTPGYGGGDSWGSKTPAYTGGDSWGAPTSTENWAGGSRTGHSEAQTPSADVSAPTPGAMNAPTPGGYSAPTPAASAPTPRPGPAWTGNSNAGWGDSAPTPAAQSAPTPGASHGGYQPNAAGKGGASGRPGYYEASTPGGFNNPQTPGTWGEGDEPRYSTPSP